MAALWLGMESINSCLQMAQTEVHRVRSEGIVYDLHNQQMDQNAEFHKQAFDQAQSHFNANLRLEKTLAFREAKRDVWDLINEKASSQMVVITLVFGCCFAVMIEGIFPHWSVA